MPEQKPIPVRLSDEVTSRLDEVAKSIGSNRAALIRLCTTTFLDYLDKVGVAGLPMDWRAIIAESDGRRSVVAEEPGEDKPLPTAKKVTFQTKRAAKKKPKTP